MDARELSICEQVRELERIVALNPVTVQILARMDQLALPDCWLVAGALYQTVWNVLCDRDPAAGIRDYDLGYFDDTDLSWEAEDTAIRAATATMAGIDAELELRNQARVHLWYEAKFGVACPPYRNTRHAISTFPSTSACVGVRPTRTGLEVFAPFGLSDLFAMTVRPNRALAPPEVYAAKAARWAAQWPSLTVLPW